MIQVEEIKKILMEKFPQSQISVEDLTGTSDHFQVLMVSPQFEGRNMVEQHQLIYGALKEQLREAIHALTLKTFTPKEWEMQKANQQNLKGIT